MAFIVGACLTIASGGKLDGCAFSGSNSSCLIAVIIIGLDRNARSLRRRQRIAYQLEIFDTRLPERAAGMVPLAAADHATRLYKPRAAQPGRRAHKRGEVCRLN